MANSTPGPFTVQNVTAVKALYECGFIYHYAGRWHSDDVCLCACLHVLCGSNLARSTIRSAFCKICVKISLIWGTQTAIFEVPRRYLTGRTEENHNMSITTAGFRSEMRDKERASCLKRRRVWSHSAAGCAMLSILVKYSIFFMLACSAFNTSLLCLWSYLGNKLAISSFICPPLLDLLTCCFPFQYHSRPQYAKLWTCANVCLPAHLAIQPVTVHTNYSWSQFTFSLCNPPTSNFNTSPHFNTGTDITVHNYNSNFSQFTSPSS